MEQENDLGPRLARAFDRRFGGGHSVERLERLSAGASRESYIFEVLAPDGGRRSLILKRDPPGAAHDEDDPDNRFGADRPTEAAIVAAAHAAGAHAPAMIFCADDADSLGAAFVMEALEGETLPQKILRDPALAKARARLPAEMGAALARLHAVPTRELPRLRTFRLDDHLAAFRAILDGYGQPQPGFEYGLRWLEKHRPPDEAPVFAHGDFRMGNIIVDTQGLAGILDWEVGHLGDRHVDLSWPSVRAWRFGRDDRPFAGVGPRETFFEAYEAAGGAPIDPEIVRYWEVLGTLRWGVMCMTIGQRFTSGREASVEKAVIGRRVAETELDFLDLIDVL
ncbi:MAG: hypothetical protein TEF_04895 [Rhizobiales bacterium NRL2]|jgi:aminoglycoside phosphotransferase (APT) family kinase protein|nr:MAG: hypothetical protein TEF_04895 [Rhizobiales bacterium NRL2]